MIYGHNQAYFLVRFMPFFFIHTENIDGECVCRETAVDENVISASVYLTGLVIAYNPLGFSRQRKLIIQLLRRLHPILTQEDIISCSVENLFFGK